MFDPEVNGVEPLHMVQLHFDQRTLMRSASKQGLPKSSEDLGYLLHGQLAAVFGDLAPKPFVARHSYGAARPRDGVEVLGYTHADEAALREQVDLFAEPADAEGALRSLAVKTLPTEWQAGRRLGFEVRVCPVVRKSKASSHRTADGKLVERQAGKEVDAFLAACDQAGENEKVGRAEVYRDWLVQRLEGAAELESFDIARLRRQRLFRRKQGGKREARLLERPDALFRGVLTVDDGPAFARLLARGIGRHRAFGFGMLLLRPPGAAP
jgi:CRISPR system Cascade subunit CasE